MGVTLAPLAREVTGPQGSCGQHQVSRSQPGPVWSQKRDKPPPTRPTPITQYPLNRPQFATPKLDVSNRLPEIILKATQYYWASSSCHRVTAQDFHVGRVKTALLLF